MPIDPLRMTEAEIAAIRKQANKDKADRAAKARAKPKAGRVKGAQSVSAPGVIGSPISGSGGAKVRASKSTLPQMNRLERLVSTKDFEGPLGGPRKSSKKKKP